MFQQLFGIGHRDQYREEERGRPDRYARPEVNSGPWRRDTPLPPAATTRPAPRPSAPKSNPFGSAKPVDQSAVLRKIEQKIEKTLTIAEPETSIEKEVKEVKEKQLVKNKEGQAVTEKRLQDQAPKSAWGKVTKEAPSSGSWRKPTSPPAHESGGDGWTQVKGSNKK
jgi:hypothetical protein